MEAPEKIYLYPSDRTGEDYEAKWGEYPWGKDCVEYTRTDAFIDKASEWLCNNYDKYIRVIGSSIYPAYSDLCRDFQNYMKGE